MPTQAVIFAATYDARGAKLNDFDKAACERVLADWMAALNAHDADAMIALMRFPHVRVASGKVVVYENSDTNPMDLFQKLVDEQGWHHSAWTDIELIQSSPNKAHYAVQYTRYRTDDSIIGVFESLYVFTRVDDVWKIQVRSSFGP